MKKLFLIITMLAAFSVSAQNTPRTDVNYVHFNKVPPTASPVTSDYWITLYNESDKFMYKMPSSAFIPMTGTPEDVFITGALNSISQYNIYDEDGNMLIHIFNDGGDGGIYIGNSSTGFNTSLTNGSIDTNNLAAKHISIGFVTPSSSNRGVSSDVDFTPYITNLDYTQKKYVDDAISAAIGGGSGTVTSVTGTDGVTVASGTTTPVIGLGDITPDSIVTDSYSNTGGSFSVDSSGNITGNRIDLATGIFSVDTAGNVLAADVNASGTITGSNLSGTNTGNDAVNSTSQPVDPDLTAIAALPSQTTYGRDFLTLVDAAAARTKIGAGTGSGTVTSVTSANTDISVATTTTTPVLTLNSGISASQIVKRDTNALIPTSGDLYSGVASPIYAVGKLLYDTDNECLTFYNNDSNVSLQVGQESWVKVKNITGSTIANGAAVYISGSSSGVPTIALAKADAGSTVVSIGLTTESIANNATGYVTSIGVVNGLNTSSFSVGAVYVSETTAGALTQTAPTAPNYRYRVGFVTKVDATTGTIHVTPSTASIGNGTANQVFGMNNAGTAQELKTIAAATGFSAVNTANTITLGTSVTGLLKGNGTGVTAAVSGTDYSAAFSTSAGLAGLLSDETGSGAAVFGTSPTLSNPIVGTQTSSDNSTKAASTAFVKTVAADKEKYFYRDMTTSAAVTSTTSNTILVSALIPAGTFTTGSEFVVKDLIRRVGVAASATFTIRVNTTNVLAGSTVLGTWTATTALFNPFKRTFTLKSGNALWSFPTSLTAINDDLNSTTTFATTTVDFTVDQYIIIAVVPSSTADSFTSESFTIKGIQ